MILISSLTARHINVYGSMTISNQLPMVMIAGPCVMESHDHAMMMAQKLDEICKKVGFSFIFKTSFDKANRTSIHAQRGVGLEKSLHIFQSIKNTLHCPVITDVHTTEQCETLADVVDILQIPAFLCRKTDLLEASAKTHKIINIKKGQFLAPWDMEQIIKKMQSFGNENIMLCERGTSFGYNTLVCDMSGLSIMAKTGYPVIFDATHSVQRPGGLGNASSGNRDLAPILARAATAVGVAGVFMEVHDDPENAPSDGPNMIRLSDFEQILIELKAFDTLAKSMPRTIK